MRRPLAPLAVLPLEDRLTPSGTAPYITSPLPPQKPTLVSVRSDGVLANNVSGSPAVTADGRYVAFWSIATNLVPGDTNLRADTFRRDLTTGQVVRVSVAADGTPANGDSQSGIAISADGRFVAFSTWANNLAAGDAGDPFDDTDIYRKDLLTGEVRLVSASAAGTVGDRQSGHPQISADGRYVLFESDATNLVAGDTNQVPDIFRKDLDTGEVIRVSTGTGGFQSNGYSYAASWSAGGRYVTFGSSANNLVPGDTNQLSDIFRKDLVTGQLIRVSVSAAGGQGAGFSADSAVSADGRYVAFSSTATNLVAGDTNGVSDIFRKDVVSGQVVRASVTAGGAEGKYESQAPTISADGRYVAFWSSSPDLTSGGLYGLIDVYRKDLVTGLVDRVSVTSTGAQGDGQAFSPEMTADGQSVAFESSSRFLVPEDTTGGGSDIYLWGPVGSATRTVTENTTAVTTVTAADSEGDALTFSVAGGADAALFTVNAATGALAFVAAPDFEAPGDANADNAYEVTVRVSDGTLTDDQAVRVVVLPAPTLPFADAFDPTPTGALSAYWTPRSGAFSVAAGAAAGTAAGANTAVVRGVTAADVAVSATVRPQVGGLLATGLVARYRGVTGTGTGDANMYWGALNVFGTAPYTQYSAQIWKNVNGTWTNINFNAVPINPADAVGKTLRFEVSGASLKLYLNDTLLCFAVDTSLPTAGGVGLRTALGSVLDDFAAVTFAPVTAALPFHDAFPANPPRQTLAPTWQERSGFFTVTTGRAVGGSAGQPNVATLNGVSAANATVTADLFFTAAGQTAQLVGRYQGTAGTGDSNYYVATLDAQAGGNALVRILKNVNGTVTELGRKSLAGFFPGGVFTTPVTAFQFRMLGTQLSVRIGATTHLTVTDGTFAAGSVGVRTSKNVGVDEFDVTSP